MARCRILTEIGRRQFLKGSGAATADAVAGTVVAGAPARAAFAPGRVTYPSNRLANLADLTVNEPLDIGLSGRRLAGRAAEARPSGRRRRWA